MAESLQMDAEGVWQLSHLGQKAGVVHIVFVNIGHYWHTWLYLSPFLSFLQWSQLYILSPFSSSAEKK